MSENLLTCANYDIEGNLQHQIDPASDIECGPNGLRYTGLVTPNIFGDQTCETNSQEPGCSPLQKTSDGTIVAPDTPCYSETSGILIDNTQVIVIETGATFVGETVIPLPANNSCYTEHIELQICRESTIRNDGAVFQAQYADFINNSQYGGAEDYSRVNGVIGELYSFSKCLEFFVSRPVGSPASQIIYKGRLAGIPTEQFIHLATSVRWFMTTFRMADC